MQYSTGTDNSIHCLPHVIKDTALNKPGVYNLSNFNYDLNFIKNLLTPNFS